MTDEAYRIMIFVVGKEDANGMREELSKFPEYIDVRMDLTKDDMYFQSNGEEAEALKERLGMLVAGEVQEVDLRKMGLTYMAQGRRIEKAKKSKFFRYCRANTKARKGKVIPKTRA